MKILVAKLIGGELAGRAKYEIVVIPVGSGIERVWRCQEVRNDEQLAVQERPRSHPQIPVRQKNDLIDRWTVFDDGLIVASAMATPHRLDLGGGIELLDQLQKLPDRESIGRQLVCRQNQFEIGRAFGHQG